MPRVSSRAFVQYFRAFPVNVRFRAFPDCVYGWLQNNMPYAYTVWSICGEYFENTYMGDFSGYVYGGIYVIEDGERLGDVS